MIPNFVRLIKLNILKPRVLEPMKRTKVTFRSGALKVTKAIILLLRKKSLHYETILAYASNSTFWDDGNNFYGSSWIIGWSIDFKKYC